MNLCKYLMVTSLFLFSTAQAAVTIEDGYVAEPIPGTHMTSVYGRLTNDDKDDVEIISISSDSSEAAELHEQTIDGDSMTKMRKIDEIIVPANGEVVLQKGGKHLMLIGLTKKLHEGDEVTVTLYYKNEEPQQITLPVKRMNEQSTHHHGH